MRVLEHEDFIPGVRVYEDRGIEGFLLASDDFNPSASDPPKRPLAVLTRSGGVETLGVDEGKD